MQSKGSRHRFSTMANRSRFPSLFISMFATFASIYVAGRFSSFNFAIPSIVPTVLVFNLNFPLSGCGRTHRIVFISSKNSIESLVRSVTFTHCSLTLISSIDFSTAISVTVLSILVAIYHFRMNHCC